LTTGESYVILSRDSYGDGGVGIVVNVESYPMYEFSASSTYETFYFDATPPPGLDGDLEHVEIPSYVYMGGVEVSGMVKNSGTSTINSMDCFYSIDGVVQGSFNFSGINLEPFTETTYSHPQLWFPEQPGEYEFDLWIQNINQQGPDSLPSNDHATKSIIVKPPRPNIIPSYISTTNSFEFEGIVNASNQVLQPRDLDFHQNGNLWVVNNGTEFSGGSTVKVTSPGESGQSSIWQQDASADHFMSLPSGIAFSNEDNFATSPSVFDANHNGGQPFTGPTLWSSDPLIYAQPSGGNGSHLDMLHESPEALGIAFETDNAYWVYDSYNKDIVRYDFSSDHGPGNSDHGDGKIWRYQGMGLDHINTSISSHLELDDDNRWLYFVDGGNQRVLRLDITTGTLGGEPSWGPHEDLDVYRTVVGYTWEEVVTTGLVEPSGIEVIDDHLVVTDYSNGDIIFYDISNMPAVELGRVETGDPGIMGVVLGPEGKVWYCNKLLNTVVKVDPSTVIVNVNEFYASDENLIISIYPNPSSDIITVEINEHRASDIIEIIDGEGRVIDKIRASSNLMDIEIQDLVPGIYFIRIEGASTSFIKH
jgi:hypothetical protein